MRFLIFIILIILLVSEGAGQRWAKVGSKSSSTRSTLISRDMIFGNPDRITTRISPDGSKLSFLAPENGVLNVFVGPANSPELARPVTNDTSRGIRSYTWGYTNGHIIYLQDRNGDENWRVYSVNLSSGKTLDLTPFEGVRAEILALSPKHPEVAVIGLNKRDPEYHDLFRLNIETGKLTELLENKDFSSFEVDDEFNVRLASRMDPEGGSDIFRLARNKSPKVFLKVEMEDALSTGFFGFDKTRDIIYLVDSRGRNTAALYALNLSTGERALLAEDPQSDFGGLMTHPTEKNVQAVAFDYDRIHWTVLDPAIAKDLDYLHNVEHGDMMVVSRSLDDKHWIVAFNADNSPSRYYHYDLDKGQAVFLFTDRKKLEGRSLARMVPAVIKSRDGLDLVSYHSLPPGSDEDGDGYPDHPLPLVLYVHGGPWGRDYWGLDPIHQWLANRGYAVLSINFRGSTGFGKSFVNAGNLEWGRKMHDDLIDAVNWSVDKGIADPEKIAIMGGSYGGYAALAGLTFTPKTFACAVDIVGPSNLITLLETIPPYWRPVIEQFTKRVGDFRTEAGRKLLQERSPLNYVEAIERPLLIGQGANDPRVKQNESDQIVKAMQAKNLPVTYVLYADEGHGFARPENRLSFYAIAEAFLAEHLGGSYEPIGQDLSGASLTVPAGVDAVPGLSAALRDKT